MDTYLAATEIIDANHPEINALATKTIKGSHDVHESARRLFYLVRDGIPYNLYVPFFLPEHYQASVTLARGSGYCVQKAVLLVALARAARIPARLIFADIRNYLASPRVQEEMGTNLFVFHGYAELHLDGRWVRVTPAFDKGVSEAHGYPLVEFDGWNDAILPPKDASGNRFVQYVRYWGAFSDLPLDLLLTAWEQVYGKERLEAWKREIMGSP